MSVLKEIASTIAALVLGLIVLIQGCIVFILIFSIGVETGFYSDTIAITYEDSFDDGFAQTYAIGYQEAFGEAFDRGFDKGYKIGLETGSKEGVATRRVELRNPTHIEMWEFLAGDETDSHPHVIGKFDCVDFSAQLINNAEANGIRAAYVHIRAEKWEHALVAFETVDRGLIFIEPQTDGVKRVAVGARYWGQTIVDFHIIW